MSLVHGRKIISWINKLSGHVTWYQHYITSKDWKSQLEIIRVKKKKAYHIQNSDWNTQKSWSQFIKLCVLQVASATSTFAMVFSSSMSVVQYYLLNRFPVPYGKQLILTTRPGFLYRKETHRNCSYCHTGIKIHFNLTQLVFYSLLQLVISF